MVPGLKFSTLESTNSVSFNKMLIRLWHVVHLQDVRLLRELSHNLFSSRLLHIERDRLFVAVHRGEIVRHGTDIGLPRRAFPAHLPVSGVVLDGGI